MKDFNNKDGWLVQLTKNCVYFLGETNMQVISELCPLHTLFALFLWYYYGVAYGFLIGIVIYLVASTILDYMGYQFISGIDAISAHEIHQNNIRNCACYMKCGSLKAEELREKYFRNKAILKFRRLRQIWVKFLGFWLFKDISPETAKHQVKKITKKIHSEKEIGDYMASLISTPLDESRPLWEIHVKENFDDDTSIVFIVFHHIIGDGMGMMNMMTFLNDNHNPDILQKHRSIPFLYRYVLPLFYVPLGLLRFIIDSRVVRGDQSLTPLHLKDGIQSSEKSYHCTKYFELEDLRKRYTQYKDTKLNSYMFAIISSSLSDCLEEYGISKEKQTHFSLSVPVNMKPPATCLDEVEFGNTCSLALVNVPLGKDMGNTLADLKSKFSKAMTLYNLRFGVWAVSFMGACPEFLYRIISYGPQKELDMIISNTPGPKNPIYFCDKKVTDIGGSGPNVGSTGLTLLISSYCDKVKVQALSDKNLMMDASKLIKTIESKM
ncbi:unnamed protein product [Moneuplotes crassus]|uniref:Diacylglycerol O-acyltransferase n=1 Tax=Euplotes crassus TaxID=5936 RepID=A0AAD1UDW5_EUPCR|nr:unnamed protein product [Moneuplotes crassus]